MDWSDERYVRLYTRDTGDMLAIGWEGRALFSELLRKADRAGILDDGDPALICELVRMPIDVVSRALDRLFARGIVEMADGALVIPNFIDAQEAKQSDRLRQSESRARRRDHARSGVTKRDQMSHHAVTDSDTVSQNVTDCHDSSHGVTDGHSPSRLVTPSLAVPSLAKPDRSTSPTKAGGPTNSAKAKKQQRPRHDWLTVYAEYPRKVGKAKGLAKLKALKASDETFVAILAAATEMGRLWQGAEQTYCPHFSAWVNQRRWEDGEQQGPSDDRDQQEPTRRIRLL